MCLSTRVPQESKTPDVEGFPNIVVVSHRLVVQEAISSFLSGEGDTLLSHPRIYSLLSFAEANGSRWGSCLFNHPRRISVYRAVDDDYPRPTPKSYLLDYF